MVILTNLERDLFATGKLTALLLCNFKTRIQMQTNPNTSVSPVQTKNEQKFSNCIVGRVLKNKSITDSANAEIREQYLKEDKETIIDALVSDFQEKFNYEAFVSELGLSEVFENWKTFNMLREEVYNG